MKICYIKRFSKRKSVCTFNFIGAIVYVKFDNLQNAVTLKLSVSTTCRPC